MIKHLITSSFAKGLSLFGALIFSWLVSLLLPISDAGLLFAVLAILPGIGVYLRFGVDQSVLKLGARNFSNHGIVGLDGILGFSARRIIKHAIILAFMTSLIWLFILEFIPEEKDKIMRWGMTLIIAPFFAALLPMSMSYRVQSRYVRSVFTEPSAVMAFSAAALAGFSIVVQPNFWHAYLSYSVFLIFLSTPLFQKLLHGREEKIEHDFQFGITQMAQYFLQWGVIGQLSLFAKLEDIAVISLAMRTVMLVNLILIMVNTVNGHKISTMLQAHQYIDLRRLLRNQSPILLGVGVLAAIFINIAAPFVYQYLDPIYLMAVSLTGILTIGQLVNVIVGPSNIMLNMSGNAQIVSKITIGVGIPVSLSVWPIYQLSGVQGIAALISFSLCCTSILSAWFASRVTGIRPMWPQEE